MKKQEEEVRVEPRGIDVTIQTWNLIVNKLIEAQKLWELHKVQYKKSINEIYTLHPESQRVLHWVVHRQKYEDFLDHVTRNVRTGLDKLIIKEGTNG